MAIYANHPIHDTFDRLELAKDFDENGRPYIEFDHSSEYSSRRERPNVLIAVTFLLELMILAFVIVLEYFMRFVKFSSIYLTKIEIYLFSYRYRLPINVVMDISMIHKHVSSNSR